MAQKMGNKLCVSKSETETEANTGSSTTKCGPNKGQPIFHGPNKGGVCKGDARCSISDNIMKWD